jgi:hypothetical protein
MARRRRERDTTAYISMLSRMIRAGGRRVAESDEFELAEFLAIREVLDEAIGVAIGGQLSHGKSWADIATATGTTKSTTFERYSKLVKAHA